MKLEINLADREEIAAAVPLLQMILAGTKPHGCTGSGQCHREPEAPLVSTGAPIIAESAPVAADPAAVFGGGAVAPAPLPPAVSIPPTAAAAIVAPPAPAITAPITTTLGPASLGAGAASVELDSKGLPWDERIHAGTKSKLKSGEWKAKKQVEAALVASVEAELRARAANANSGMAQALGDDAAKLAAMGIDPLTGLPLASPAAVFAAAPGVPAAPAPFVPPAAPLAPAAPAAPLVSADPTTFEQLMPRITAAVTGGILPPTAVGAACAAHGVASVVTLQTNPRFVPLVWATLKQQYPSLA